MVIAFPVDMHGIIARVLGSRRHHDRRRFLCTVGLVNVHIRVRVLVRVLFSRLRIEGGAGGPRVPPGRAVGERVLHRRFHRILLRRTVRPGGRTVHPVVLGSLLFEGDIILLNRARALVLCRICRVGGVVSIGVVARVLHRYLPPRLCRNGAAFLKTLVVMGKTAGTNHLVILLIPFP